MKPFLKWAGNKYGIIDHIRGLLPKGDRLIEPFIGSGAVFLNTNYASALLADNNSDLISLYKILQKEQESFISYCATFFTEENNTATAYYRLREEFNNTSNKRRKAALFLYLNRHGYNGLCRYNSKGKYNVPMGKYSSPYFPVEEMRSFYKHAKRAQFQTADFRAIMSHAKIGDVVYCDPPYVPLSNTANFSQYSALGFGRHEQDELARLAEKLAMRGIPVIISNHDTSYTVRTYQKAALTRLSVRRLISSNGQNRGKAKELLAFFKAAG